MSQDKRKVYRVLPDGENWKLKADDESNENAFGTQAEAVARGREIAREHGHSQLVVHRHDGKIGDESTYGDDPFPPAG